MNSEAVDDTKQGLMRGLKHTAAVTFSLEDMMGGLTMMSADNDGSEQLHRTMRPINLTPITYAHKTHYRIVFREEGTTIDRVRKFRDVMSTLTDTVDGAFSSDCVMFTILNMSLHSFTTASKLSYNAVSGGSVRIT